MSPEYTQPLREKKEMFLALILGLIASMTAEAITQLLVVADGTAQPYIMMYELSNVVAIGFIGYYFRPRGLSPYFFMQVFSNFA